MVIGEYSSDWRAQVEAAAQRYTDTATKRQEVEEERKKTGSVVVDTEEQIIARSDRLLTAGQVSPQAFIDIGAANSLSSLETRERIIGASNQMQAVSFLARGVRVAATVARISLMHNGREIPQGTGSLVSPQLLLTNNHVLPDTQSARAAAIEFRAEVDIENTPCVPLRFHLDPLTFFVTDEHLDFTLVAVALGPDSRYAADVVGGWNRLIAQQGKIVIGESMNIIGHPMGRLKEISIRENRLELQLDDFLHYVTDTEPGNSGSPVFNDQWEVVALHHSGVPKTDSSGRILRRDDNLWHPNEGADAVCWVANEGVRVSAVLKNLAALDLDRPKRTLLAEMGPAAAVVLTESIAAQRVAPSIKRQVRVESVEAAAPRRGVRARPTAFGGRRHLLFLHGRGQQGRNPDELRRVWTAGLNRGLTLAGMRAVDPGDVYFPFYGDALLQPLATESLAASGAGGTYELLLSEAAERLGMPREHVDEEPLAEEGLADIGTSLLSRTRTQLGWIAARSGLDEVLIAQHFRDVAAYLSDDSVRDGVLDAVKEAVPGGGRLALISHSLGTVVAVDLMSHLSGDVEVDLLVTAGSPLGLDAVYKKLQAGGANRPERIGHWLNVWYAGDPVAIGCPLAGAWHGQIEDLAVNNPKDRAHDIVEYLAHATAARIIGRRLDAA